MTEQKSQPEGTNQPPYSEDEDEIKLTDLLLVLLRRKKFILFVVLLAVVVSIIVSLSLPFSYTAKASILPPSESAATLFSQIGGALGVLPGGFVTGKTTADLYVGVLASNSVSDIIIDRFNLKEHYKSQYKSDLYKILSGMTTFSVDRKTQIISISVQNKDPKWAADLANAYVDALDKINQKVYTTEGHRKKVFLDNRLKKLTEELSKAEAELKAFQEKYKLFSIDEQARVAIEGAAKIKGEIIAA
jgi:uncharacterized protein involved in exopolysaccharide biosynthesis